MSGIEQLIAQMAEQSRIMAEQNAQSALISDQLINILIAQQVKKKAKIIPPSKDGMVTKPENVNVSIVSSETIDNENRSESDNTLLNTCKYSSPDVSVSVSHVANVTFPNQCNSTYENTSVEKSEYSSLDISTCDNTSMCEYL